MIAQVHRFWKRSSTSKPDQSVTPGRIPLFVIGSVDESHHSNVSQIAEQAAIQIRRVLYNLYFGQDAKWEPIVRPANIKWGKIWANKMWMRAASLWGAVIFSD